MIALAENRNIIPSQEILGGGLCMKGGIYSDDKCPVCGHVYQDNGKALSGTIMISMRNHSPHSPPRKTRGYRHLAGNPLFSNLAKLSQIKPFLPHFAVHLRYIFLLFTILFYACYGGGGGSRTRSLSRQYWVCEGLTLH